MDSLDKLQSGDKNLDAIMKQIADLAKSLMELQQAMAQLAQQMPDDFMNAEQMQGLGMDEMFKGLDEIRKKLQAGDIEGARQLARELFNQMAQMVAAMQNMQRSQMASSMGRMQGEMQRQTNELQEIAREQQEILVKTENLNSAGLTERDAALKSKLEQFLARSIAELGKLTELFPDREGPDDPNLLTNLDDATMNALLRNLIAKLSQKDFPGFNEGDGYIRKELAKKRTPVQEPKAQRADKSIGDIKNELEKLLNEPAQALSDADKRALRELAQREDVLKERTETLHEKLGIAVPAFPPTRSQDRPGHRRSRPGDGQRPGPLRPARLPRRGAAGAPGIGTVGPSTAADAAVDAANGPAWADGQYADDPLVPPGWAGSLHAVRQPDAAAGHAAIPRFRL